MVAANGVQNMQHSSITQQASGADPSWCALGKIYSIKLEKYIIQSPAYHSKNKWKENILR